MQYVVVGGIALQVDLVIALGKQDVPIAGRDDLNSMKRAAGRPIDLEDIAALTEPEHRQRNDADGSRTPPTQ